MGVQIDLQEQMTIVQILYFILKTIHAKQAQQYLLSLSATFTTETFQ